MVILYSCSSFYLFGSALTNVLHTLVFFQSHMNMQCTCMLNAEESGSGSVRTTRPVSGCPSILLFPTDSTLADLLPHALGVAGQPGSSRKTRDSSAEAGAPCGPPPTTPASRMTDLTGLEPLERAGSFEGEGEVELPSSRQQSRASDLITSKEELDLLVQGALMSAIEHVGRMSARSQAEPPDAAVLRGAHPSSEPEQPAHTGELALGTLSSLSATAVSEGETAANTDAESPRRKRSSGLTAAGVPRVRSSPPPQVSAEGRRLSLSWQPVLAQPLSTLQEDEQESTNSSRN